MARDTGFTRRRFSAVAGAAGTTATLAGGGALGLALTRCAPGAAPPGDILLGQIAGITGPMASTAGKATLDGAEMAVDEVTRAGGWQVRGQKRKVVLLTADDEHKPEVAVAAALKLINQEHVTALIGPPLSTNALPVADAAEKARIPIVCPGATVPALTEGKRYVFRVSITDAFTGAVLARFARQELGATRAAALYEATNAFGKTVSDVFRQTFEAAGGRATVVESYVNGERDFSRQLGRIKEAGADVLFLPNFDADVRLQTEQARDAGLKVTFLGPDSWGTLSADTVKHLSGAYYVLPWSADTIDERGQAFVRAYRERFGAVARQGAALAYDAVGLVLEAIKRQGKTDPESIRSGLLGITRHPGASGTLSFNGSGDPVRSAIMLKITGDQARFYKPVNP